MSGSCINQLIYQVFQADNDQQMSKNYLHNISVLIPYTRASCYLADFAGQHILTDGLGINLQPEHLALYPEYYHEMDYDKWIFGTPDSQVYNTNKWFPQVRA